MGHPGFVVNLRKSEAWFAVDLRNGSLYWQFLQFLKPLREAILSR